MFAFLPHVYSCGSRRTPALGCVYSFTLSLTPSLSVWLNRSKYTKRRSKNTENLIYLCNDDFHTYIYIYQEQNFLIGTRAIRVSAPSLTNEPIYHTNTTIYDSGDRRIR